MSQPTPDRPGDGDARLDRALAGLPRSLEPARDLWPAIESRLEPRSARGGRHGWGWAAAAAVVLVAASALVTATLLRREPATPVTAAAPPAARPGAEAVPAVQVAAATAAFGPGHRIGPAYLANRRLLARELGGRIERLSPEGRAQLERNLAELRRASAEINAALELRPGDPLLEELLFNAYQDEISVLANVDRLTATDTPTDPTRIPL